MLGEFLTIWTIRLSLVCLAGALATRLLVAPDSNRRGERALWTAGCGLFVAHVVGAFQFYHHWSHAHAWEDTARQTRELLGWAFGSGIYFSYVFLLLWVADVAWWWLAPATYLRRPRWVDRTLLGDVLFIAFKGAAVFEGGVTRWGTGVACVVLAGLLARRAWRTKAIAEAHAAALSPVRTAAGPVSQLPVAEAPCRNKS